MADVQALFDLMSAQHGVASCAQARALGLGRRAEQRLLRLGVLGAPCPGVLAATGAPLTFRRRAMAAALAPGVLAVSHGAAARLHALDGFAAHETVDVLGGRGANPPARLGARVRRTRGDVRDHLTAVDGIPVLSVGATLALLAPSVGVEATGRALDSALRRGVPVEELGAAALAWRSRGRAGPQVVLRLLAERGDQRFPRQWFRRLAAAVRTTLGVELVAAHPVPDGRGGVVAELELADPDHRVGVDHRDDARDARLRRLGWQVVTVRWSDRRDPDRVVSELTAALRARR